MPVEIITLALRPLAGTSRLTRGLQVCVLYQPLLVIQQVGNLLHSDWSVIFWKCIWFPNHLESSSYRMSQKQPFHYAGMILLIATFYTYPYRNILCAPFVSVFNGLGNQTQGCGKPMTSFLLTMNFKMDDGMGNGYIHRNVQSNRLNDC